MVFDTIPYNKKSINSSNIAHAWNGYCWEYLSV